MIRVGHIALSLSKGEITDHKVINIVEDEVGCLNLVTGNFSFINKKLIIDYFDQGITAPETVDQVDDITVPAKKVENLKETIESFQRGCLVSFTYAIDGASLEIKGIFMDYLDYPDGYCLISELGCSVFRFWRVPSWKVKLHSTFSLRH